jgi:large conductance mechanosensitive channel
MSIVKEFKEFATKGNVVDLAVGIIIGGAFGKIVSSLVADVIMPPLGLLIGGVNFTDIKFTLKDAVIDTAGKVSSQAVTLNIGNFIQVVFDFIIVAFAIFLMIKAINRMKRKKEAAPATPSLPTKEEILLTEIRDLLKNK